MRVESIRAAVFAEASRRVEASEVTISDYKDMAAASSNEISGILFERPRLAVFFEDMPDGFNCPRSFLDWGGAVKQAEEHNSSVKKKETGQ